MNKPLNLLDIVWEDILIPKILTKISLKDCFNLRCVSKSSLHLVKTYFSRMKNLIILNYTNFPDRSFQVLSSSCRRLCVLNCARSSFVTDETLIPLLKANNNLVHLTLSHCKKLTACSLQPIILYSKNLRVLKLARCAWLTTGAVEALTLHQSSLEDVDFSYCTQVSETCIILFLKKFRHLRVLSLEGLQIGDKSMFALSKFSMKLQHLNVSHCKRITNAGMGAVGKNCNNLESLSVRQCGYVTEISLGIIRRNVMIDRPIIMDIIF